MNGGRVHRRGTAALATLSLAFLFTFVIVGQEQDAQPAPAPAPPSASAQRAYGRARAELLQVRTLLKGQDSQASVGSGFLVSDDGMIVTNYHVVSDAALNPDRYRLVFSTTDRTEGALQILAFDALHDLAVVKPKKDGVLAGRDPLSFRSNDEPLTQGEQIYSLGNPLDVGFAVSEGTYNGLAERSVYDTIFFGGSLNPGVSGGPTLDDAGRVIGVNVAARWDGEQVSFLVPATFAEALVERARSGPPVELPAYEELTRQLMTHQQSVTEQFMAQGWRQASHARYAIPLPHERFMRCWGTSTPADTKGLEYEQSRCAMDSYVFVSSSVRTGAFAVRHEVYDGRKLGTLRFADRYSDSFANEQLETPGTRVRTAPQCHERYVDRGGLPMRVLICMTAYRKLPGLYDVAVLAASLDDPQGAVMGRFDARGVSFDNALKLSAHYLDGFGLAKPAEGAHQ